MKLYVHLSPTSQTIQVRGAFFNELQLSNILVLVNMQKLTFIRSENCLENLPKVMILFTNPSTRAGYDTRSIFKRSLTGLNSEFSFSYTSCLTKAEEPCLSYYLPVAGGRIIGFIPFPKVLVQ